MPRRRSLLAAGAALAVFTVAIVPAPAVAASSVEARYAFAEAVSGGRYAHGQAILDVAGRAQSGSVVLAPTSAGLLTQVPNPIRSSGTAVQFGDAGCQASGATVRCARLGRVSIPSPSGFSPRASNFAVEATIRFTAAPPAGAAGGMNLVQLGNSLTPDEWKLQVDYGKPSCVVRASPGVASFVARPTALTVGVSYRLRCARVGSQLSLTVTPLGAGGIGTPEAPRVAPTSAGGYLDEFGAVPAIQIGSKGSTINPDQLANAVVDDITYALG